MERQDQQGSSSQAREKEKEYKENVKKNATALRIIQQGVSKTIYPRIYGIKKAKEAWDTLKIEFQGSEKVISIKLQSLWSEFENLSMKKGELVKKNFSRVAEIVNQIKSCGDAIPEKKVVEKILRGLPQKFEHIVVVIEETKDLTKFTQYKLLGSLEAREKRVNKYNNQPMEHAFQAKVNNSRNFKPEPKGRGISFHGQFDNRSRGRSESVDESYLWHLRYGHLNLKSLPLLKQKNMVVGLPEIKQQHEACEGCIYGKMHRFPFPKTAWRAHFPLELVHADICGPTRTPLGNKRDVIFDETTTWKWETKEVTEVPMEGLFLEPKELVKEIVGSLRSNYEDDSDSGSPPRRFMNAPKKDSKLVGFCDSDWAESLDDRRSNSAYVFCLGSKIISWSSKKQSSVALSSAEAEYIVANEVVREAVWLRRILVDLPQKGTDPTLIYCDNQSAISMTKNPVFHGRSKHIELRHNYIRDMVQKKEIHLDFIKTIDKRANVLIKTVSIEKLQRFKDMMKITN
ncbi:hypothetical protein ZIOFF_049349 [Zingiber officinale]|uniref:GAG-pre-integrase domain-containing protein n=1 Tax=Zingiber officinale TaxID=94328 RepID=A0A8J5FWR7_ZINOF|nr:hypothetical protein ZIOFF_049349 [Zingiber officinale]